MPSRLVTAEDPGEFRILRAAAGEEDARRWLQGFLEPEGIGCDQFLAELQPLVEHLEVVTVGSPEELDGVLGGDDVLLVERLVVGPDLLERAGRPARVVSFGGDVRNVDGDALAAAGVAHRIVERTTTANVADHTLLLILALVRRFDAARVLPGDRPTAPPERSTEVGGHPPTVFNWKGVRGIRALGALRVGLVGAGEIGQAVAARLQAFGAEVAYAARRPVPALDGTGAHRTTVPDLAAWSDVLSLHVPYDRSLHHLVDREILEALGPNGFLVNTSRGLLIDGEALLDALVHGAIAGAGLDVFPDEPLPPGDPLLERPEVVLTAHVGGGTRWTVLADAVATARAVTDEEENE